MEQLRACRLVVDTGMHAFGWSRDKALNFMLENTAMAEHDAGCEVTRYITWPGQACAYKVGERKIRELRTRCENEIKKEAFDIRDFYGIVLNAGAVPLTKLEEMIDEYIAKSNGGKEKEEAKANESKEENFSDGSADFLGTMTFASGMWCKCCVVPGSHLIAEANKQ